MEGLKVTLNSADTSLTWHMAPTLVIMFMLVKLSYGVYRNIHHPLGWKAVKFRWTMYLSGSFKTTQGLYSRLNSRKVSCLLSAIGCVF